MEQYGTNRLREILKRIDEEAELELGMPDTRFKVILVGGSAFMLTGLTNRPATHDIDVLEVSKDIEDILFRYGMINSRVSAYLDCLPYSFEDRLVLLDLDTSAIDFMTPSLEDLAVMKLYACRPNDIADLTSPLVLEKIDWALLDHLVFDKGEALGSCMSPRRYEEMLVAYRKYVERYRP